MTKKVDGLERLCSNPMSVISVPSDDIVEALKAESGLQGINIGALYDLRKFNKVSHVIYLVKERKKNASDEPRGDSICMIITGTGYIRLEMSKRLYEFWNHWESQGSVDFSQIAEVVADMCYFFEHKEPKSERLYKFRDGRSNTWIHRTMRSEEKTADLKSVFGYEIRAS